jgi:CubicO group peptidase (beta-lactamase class C family)
MPTDIYYPPPESKGGWRWLKEPQEVRAIAGVDLVKLDMVREQQDFNYSSDSWSVAIIRRGYLVREFFTFNIAKHTRFDIWSGAVSFTGTAWGLLLDDSRQGRLPGDQQVDLDSPVYAFIPEGYPLTDPRKERITIRHLLSMTSGIPGEAMGVRGNPTAMGYGPFEHALGRCPNRYGRWVDKLLGEPGTIWDYSGPAMSHLALAFANITGREMSDYLQERVFEPVGIENPSWDVEGGSGFMGPHNNAHSGLHISARELARFGYLMLHNGVWKGEQLIPKWWIDLATKSSQDLNPAYGFAWWVNTEGAYLPGLPADAFVLSGYRTNRCYIIPSLDLVVARVASGPPVWNDQWLIGRIVAAIIRD